MKKYAFQKKINFTIPIFKLLKNIQDIINFIVENDDSFLILRIYADFYAQSLSKFRINKKNKVGLIGVLSCVWSKCFRFR